jgi:hypothetical protein
LLNLSDLTPRLEVPLPFTVYLHQTGVRSRGTMLQVSHYVDQILTQNPAPNQLELIDRAFALVNTGPPADAPSTLEWTLFFRVRQPLIAGRTYRCAVVLHGPDREPIESLRTAEISVPPLP